MGYSTRNGGLITDYWPDDCAKCFYITSDSNPSLAEILDRAKEKWGDDIDLGRIRIGAEKIHTSCLTYDLYDPSDYTEFVVVTLEDE